MSPGTSLCWNVDLRWRHPRPATRSAHTPPRSRRAGRRSSYPGWTSTASTLQGWQALPGYPHGAVPLARHSRTEGFQDGKGDEARFHGIFGLALERGGCVLVCDTHNHSVRQVSPHGQVGA